MILGVEKNTPAYDAGLELGDLIIEVNGKKIENPNDLKNSIASINPGTVIDIKLERENRIKKVEVKLGIMPNSNGYQSDALENFGLFLADITAQTIRKHKLSRDEEGVLVSGVKIDSKAFKSGFRKGDIIFRVQNEKIKSVEDFKKAMRKSDNIKKIFIRRNGFVYILTLP